MAHHSPAAISTAEIHSLEERRLPDVYTPVYNNPPEGVTPRVQYVVLPEFNAKTGKWTAVDTETAYSFILVDPDDLMAAMHGSNGECGDRNLPDYGNGYAIVRGRQYTGKLVEPVVIKVRQAEAFEPHGTGLHHRLTNEAIEAYPHIGAVAQHDHIRPPIALMILPDAHTKRGEADPKTVPAFVYYDEGATGAEHYVRRGGERLPTYYVFQVIDQVADALTHIHAHGRSYGGISLRNIGIHQFALTGAFVQLRDIDETGPIKRVRGEVMNDVVARGYTVEADIAGLAEVLWKLLVGTDSLEGLNRGERIPLAGYDAMDQHNMGEDLKNVIRHAILPQSRDRYKSIDAFMADIHRIIGKYTAGSVMRSEVDLDTAV